MDTDELRARMDAQQALAMALFEAQFTLCGGRMPADPTWDDLDESEREEFRGEAERARVVLDAALVAQAAGVESFTEWGVRWPSGYVVVRSTEDDARTLLRAIRPAEKPELVSHIVTQTAWTAVDLTAEGGDSGVRADA